MNTVLTLLRPRFKTIMNGGRSNTRFGRVGKFILLGLIGSILWGGLYTVSIRVLSYFRGIEEIGDILGFKLLSMILITSFALLIFSSIITSLSKLYLSRDLFLVHSFPVAGYKVFIARWIDSTVESSWMVIVFTLPVFIAYGVVFNTGIFYYMCLLLALISLSIIASAAGVFLVMISVIIIPANRMKSIFVFLSLFFFIIIYIAIRFLKPELLVDPEIFDSVLIYITVLQTPSSPLLPTTWAFDAIKAGLNGHLAEGIYHLAISWSFAGCMFFIIVMTADSFYTIGFSKTQTAHVRLIKSKSSRSLVLSFLPRSIRAFAEKEIKIFFRDQTQWTQLFLIGALIVIYIYNFNALPLEKSPIKTVYLQNLLAFLNMGLALFVLTAVTGRFAYPAVSAEKSAFWIIESAPAPLKKFLWIKFFIYYLPLLLLTQILIVATNILLQVTPFMMVLSIITVFFLVPGIVAMGIGLGAAFPDFKAENPTQTVTSFGGLVFMILSAGLIGLVLIMEAGPVYKIFIFGLRGIPLSLYNWLYIAGSFFIIFVISILAIILPMKFGEKSLSRRFS